MAATSHNKIPHCCSFSWFDLGMFSCSVPLYLIEVSPTPVRGSLTSTTALFFILGALFGQILGHSKVFGNKEDFPLMAVTQGIVATICILLLLLCPESPRFLFIQKKNETKARKVLRNLRIQEDLGKEIQELEEEDFYEAMANEKNMTLRKFLFTPKFRWRILTIIVMMAGSQLCGVNAVFYYIEKVYVTLELPKSISDTVSTCIYLTVLITLITSINLIEKWGRRILLIMGFMICSMTCILFTFTLEFQEENYVLCFLSLIFITFFLIGYMIGPGPISIVLVGELFLQSTRSVAFAIGFSILWFFRFVSGLILIKLEFLLGSYSLMVYWPFITTTFIYLFYMIPKTKGRTFVEIQLTQMEEE